MKTFNELGLNPELAEALAKMEYTKPTPIQAKGIPLALEGRDIMGSAQTGTGKTAAYSIPLIEHLLNRPGGSALVLTPTRELAKQVMEIMRQMLGGNQEIKTAFIIGGESMGKQLQQLKKQPRLIVGTPGGINDHLQRKTLKIGDTDFLVLDETDRMLDMGFSVQLDRIAKFLPEERQTLMFSATLPKNILKLSEQYLNNPARIAVGSTVEPQKNIKQQVIRLNDTEKFDELTRQMEYRDGSVIIFVKTKYGTERLAKRLRGQGFEAEAIHGDLKQSRRERVIQNLRDDKFRILVATDVVARGLDIPHIRHVVNYDLPQVPEDFIHRIGRTARAGAEGEALSFVSPSEGRKWHAIELLIDPDVKSRAPKKSGVRARKGAKNRGDDKPFKKKKPFKGANKNRTESDSRPKRKEGEKEFKRFGKNRRDDTRKDNSKPTGKKKPARKFNDREDSESKPYSDKPRHEGRRDDKPYGKKPYGGKPRRDDRDGDSRPDRSDRPNKGGKKPAYKKSGDSKSGGKSFGGKPSGKKPFGSGKSSGNRGGSSRSAQKPNGPNSTRRRSK